MNFQDSTFTQAIKIKEIHSFERESAANAWNRAEAGHDEESNAKELGFPIDYLRNLLAQEFIIRLDEGLNYSDFPRFSNDLETYCWKRVASLCIADQSILVNTPLCKQFRLKLLVLFVGGESLQDLIENYNLQSNQARDLLMIALAEDGMTLNEIGAQFNVTRERVRQILKTFGVSTRSIKQQRDVSDGINQTILIQTVHSWIMAHPGCRISEVATALEINELDVLRLCPKVTQRFLIGIGRKVDPERYRTFTRQQILEAIRKAFELRNPSMSMYSVSELRPLSGPYYERLRNQRTIFGPSLARILQVFGTWKEACEEAGVTYISSVRDLYEIRWTNEELIDQVAEFISTTESRSAESFDAWCRLDSSRASLGTVRNQIGGWSVSYELALVNLRKQWTRHQP